MKKLLITSMAAVAVSICAKATETYTYNTTESFENYNGVENYEGPLFGTQEENPEAYEVTAGWVTTATPEDGIFTVTNIANYVGAGTHGTVSRPIDATPNTKALAIDTSNPLMRTVYTNKTATNSLEQAVFFDSVVQFTATDAKPTPGEGDKLMIWLYKSEDVSGDDKGAFGESIPTNALVVTALNNEGEMEHFLTDMVIEPDSWHRLTIKSFKDANNDDVLFNIWVDTTKVGGDFVSLLNSDDDARNLAGVAFDGKGAVDDLVFTTTAPEFAEGGGEDPATYAINAQYVQNDVVVSFWYDEGGSDLVEDPTSIDIENSTVYIYIQMKSGATLTGVTVNETPVTNLPDMEDNAYNIQLSFDDPTPGTEYNVVINTTNSGSGGDPEVTEKPTVGDNTYDTGADLTAAVKSDMTITVPSGWSVDGKVLKDDKGDTFATFAPYYILTQDGLTVAVTLDQKAAAPFAEATDLTDGQEVFDLDETMDDESPAVGIHIKTYSGLWYGLDTATELGDWGGLGADDWVPGNGSKLQLKAAKPAGNAAFFMIRVRDTDPVAE